VESMNTPASIWSPEKPSLETSSVCRIVLLCEDSLASMHAMEVCGHLVSQLGSELTFDFYCCKFDELANPLVAHDTIEAAVRADILLFSTHGNDLPRAVCQWLDLCAEVRTATEGALAVFISEPINPLGRVSALLDRLEIAALKLRMDFLPLAPEPIEPPDAAEERANSITPLLTEILNRPPMDHWGLNE
jgi:hypothetical protein